MPRKKVKDMTLAEKREYEEKQRIKKEKEKQRANAAFLYIYENMRDIERSQVTSSMIDTWVDTLNRMKVAGGIRFKRKDFLILSEGCDPFNADYRYFQELGEWFRDQWLRFKPDATKVHVRGLHYALQTLADTPDAVRMPNDNIYDNDDSSWSMLENAGKYARNNGLFKPGMFDDRRSREPITYHFEDADKPSLWVSTHLWDFTKAPEWESSFSFPDFPSIPDFPDLPAYGFLAYSQQRYRLEVWIEKSTQEDVVKPVCERHRITLVTAIGEISQSAVEEAVERAGKYGDQTTTVILYISDFDPAGQSMPVAAARKIEFSLMKRESPAHIRLYPIILTYEQCLHYNLPSAPMKETEKRGDAFRQQYGIEGSVELDALESLHPGELAKLLEQEISHFRDDTIEKRARDRRWEIREELKQKSQDVQKNYNMDGLKEEYKEKVLGGLSSIKDAHYEIQAEFQDLVYRYTEEVVEPFREWYTDTFKLFADKLEENFNQVAKELEENKPDVEAYDIPQAEEIPLDEACLFDSKRAYVPQLGIFKQFAGKFGYAEDDEDGDLAS